MTWVVKVNRSYNDNWMKVFTDEELMHTWIERYVEHEKIEFSRQEVSRFEDGHMFQISIDGCTVVEVEKAEVNPTLICNSYSEVRD